MRKIKIVLYLFPLWTGIALSLGSYAQDANYDYPGGLVDFAAECGYSYMNTQVKLYFYDEQSSDILLRKYNPNTRQYADMTSFIAATSDLTIDGHNVAVILDIVESNVGHSEFITKIIINCSAHRQQKCGQHF